MPLHDNITGGELSDEILAAQVARGQSSALETLYDRYARIVFGISLKILCDRAAAEDVLQETFWRVWQRAASYQSQRGPFKGWLCKITHNLAIDAYRQRSIRLRRIADVDDPDRMQEQIADPNIDVAEQSQLILRHGQVTRALVSLPDTQRQVIVMAYFYGMTRQEIAESTGEALGTIHTRARMALQKLRKQLQKEELED